PYLAAGASRHARNSHAATCRKLFVRMTTSGEPWGPEQDAGRDQCGEGQGRSRHSWSSRSSSLFRSVYDTGHCKTRMLAQSCASLFQRRRLEKAETMPDHLVGGPRVTQPAGVGFDLVQPGEVAKQGGDLVAHGGDVIHLDRRPVLQQEIAVAAL